MAEQFNISENLPEELQKLVATLGKKAPLVNLRKVILALCEWRDMTPAALAEILRRDRKRLVRKHLTPMIKEGVLTYKHPQMLGHPGQAYRASKKGS